MVMLVPACSSPNSLPLFVFVLFTLISAHTGRLQKMQKDISVLETEQGETRAIFVVFFPP